MAKKLCLTMIFMSLAFVMPDRVEAAKKLKIKDIIRLTMENNPEIKAERSREGAQREVIRQTQAGYFPTLDFRGGFGYEHTMNKFSSNSCSGGSSCTEQRFRHDPTLTLTQKIWDGNKTNTDVCKAKAEYFQSLAKTQETIELAIFNAVNAAVDVRRFQRLLKLSRENVAEHQRILKKINELIDGGRATVADRHTVESRLHDAQSAVVDIEGDYDSAIARYIEIVGIKPGKLASTEVKKHLLPKSEREAISYSIHNNYSVKLSKESLKVAKSEVNAAYVPFLPDLRVEVDVKREDSTEARTGFQYNLTAQAVLRYNLLNGGADAARLRETTKLVAEQRHRMETVIRTARREIGVSWAERKSALAQEEKLRESVDSKKEVLNVFRQQFDLGTRSLLDLLDAANEYFLAKGSLITVDATADLTGYRMMAAMGVLREKYGFLVPKPADTTVHKKMHKGGNTNDGVHGAKDGNFRLAKKDAKGHKGGTVTMAKADKGNPVIKKITSRV